MGVQILNKDVSVISGVMGKAKASIGNIFGKTGWSGGGVDVTPTPLPNWDEQGAYSGYTSVAQILGINQPITLKISWPEPQLYDVNVYIGTTNPPTSVINCVSNGEFVVNLNDYVFFDRGGWQPVTFISNVTITNSSDAGAPVDNFTLGYLD